MSAKENAPAIHCESASPDRSISTTDDTARPGDTVSAALPPMPLYVIVVETRSGNFTRRPYMSLSSAEKAVKRAQARGVYATIRLLACTPVPGGGFE